MAGEVYISQSDLNRAFKDLDNISKHMRGDEWRRQTMKNAAQFVSVTARKRVSKSNEAHYYYKNRIKGKRRGKGKAIGDRVKIQPGNLGLSIQHLDKLKKTPNAVVGPKIKNRIGNLKNIGKSASNSSGFYAWMAKPIYAGAEDFRRDIMEPALAQSISKIIAYVDRETEKQIQKLKPRLSVFR